MALSFSLMKNLFSMMLMVVVGYAIVKIRFLKSRDAQPLSMLTAYVLTPCLILEAFQRDITVQQMNGFLVAMLVATLCMLLFIGLAALLKKPMHLDAVACGNEPFRASFYNVFGTLLCVITLPVMIYLFQLLFS
ncbi:MAG: AEC family transporter [Bilifractor sp.]